MMKSNRYPRNPYKNGSGFTLLEVLVTLVVLAIGLLGLAGLQATGLKSNLTAYYRSQATQFSYDIADRMRANMVAINSYPTNDPSTANEQASCLTAAGCTPSQMAENDLYEWNLTLTSALPSGTATISPANAGIYTIAIQWDNNRDGAVNGNDPEFQMSFQP